MELIFIFFVLYMLFSVLTRAFRAAADQKRNFPRAQQAPTSQSRDHTGDPSSREGKLITDEPDAFPWQKFLFPEDSSFPEDSAVEPQPEVAVKRHALLQKMPGAVDGSIKKIHRELPRPGDLYHPGPPQKRTGQVAPSGLDLQNYLKRANLPRAVVAAVVLGAPRSKDPLPQSVRRDRHCRI